MNIENLQALFYPVPVYSGTENEMNNLVNVGSPFIFWLNPLDNDTFQRNTTISEFPVTLRFVETCEANVIDKAELTNPIIERCKHTLASLIFRYQRELFMIANPNGRAIRYDKDRNYVGYEYTFRVAEPINVCC